MVKLRVQGGNRDLDVPEIRHPASLIINWTLHVNLNLVRMTVHPSALVALRDTRKVVCRLEAEFAEDIHYGIPRYLCVCRLSRHCG
jgi:hypothetical protein